MPRCLPVLLALTLAACGAPRVLGHGVDFDVQLYGGYRALNADTFDGHPAYALEFATSDTQSGWGYEILGGYGAEDGHQNGVEREAEFDELALGLRHTRAAGGLTTVYGFGAALTRVENTVRNPTREFDDDGGALYAHAALLWDVGRVSFDPGTDFQAGLDLRALVGDDYDYLQLALVLGFGR